MKHRKCDRCDKPATVYMTEIIDGKKIEKNLCEDCATAEGITIKANVPISELLEEFVLHTSGAGETAETACDVCGITFAEFRKKGLLGCPHDYDVFTPVLAPLLSRAQEGSTQHTGKVPHRAGSDQHRQTALLRLRSELKAAIAAEDYERAAALRDQIKQSENS